MQTGVELAVCTADRDQEWPAVSGSIIVWQDRRNGDYDIYMAELPQSLTADLNGDGVVNQVDLSILAAQWTTTEAWF